MNGNVFSSEGISPTLTTNKGEGNKIALIGNLDNHIQGRVYDEQSVAPTINGRDYKSPRLVGGEQIMLYALTKQSSEQSEKSQIQSPQEKTEESAYITKKERQ